MYVLNILKDKRLEISWDYLRGQLGGLVFLHPQTHEVKQNSGAVSRWQQVKVLVVESQQRWSQALKGRWIESELSHLGIYYITWRGTIQICTPKCTRYQVFELIYLPKSEACWPLGTLLDPFEAFTYNKQHISTGKIWLLQNLLWLRSLLPKTWDKNLVKSKQYLKISNMIFNFLFVKCWE